MLAEFREKEYSCDLQKWRKDLKNDFEKKKFDRDPLRVGAGGVGVGPLPGGHRAGNNVGGTAGRSGAGRGRTPGPAAATAPPGRAAG